MKLAAVPILVLCGISLAQTTRPADGLTMSVDQMRERMEAMNRKVASTQATTQRIFDELIRGVAARDAVSASLRTQMEIGNRWVGARSSAQQQIAPIDARLREIEANGQMLQTQYNQTQAEAAADIAQAGTLHRETSGRVGLDTVRTETNGTDNAARQLAASRWDTKLNPMLQQLQDLAAEKQQLLQQRAAIGASVPTAQKNATVTNILSQNAAVDAAIRTQRQMENIKRHPPEIDYMAIWEKSLASAKAAVPENDPQVQRLAMQFFEFSYGEEVRKRIFPATQPAENDDPLGIKR